MILNRKFGPYVLLRQLAIGGMAEIDLALKLGPGQFEKFVVIKRILPQFNDNPDYVRLFYREAELSGLLQHPNVVHTFDCDIRDDTHFMVMEYMEGVTVAEMAERGAEMGLPLPQDFAISICIDACEGLHYVHSLRNDEGTPLGVVHRDISPQNVFVTYDGIAKVFDFGIARFADDAESDPHKGMLAGKYAYMSPEQCRSGALDARSDVFSLGTILYELTTGYRLFKRESQVQTLRAVTEDPIRGPSELLERYPRFLERVVLKALARDPAQRYASARELAEDLRKFLKISGSKPTPHLLADFLRQLFSREIAEQEVYRQQAVRDVERVHGRRDPLAELYARIPARSEPSLDLDVELIPDLGPTEVPPLPGAPALRSEAHEVHVPARPTGPQRLALVQIAEEEEISTIIHRRALVRARRTNRILAAVAIIAILVGAATIAYFVLQRTATGPAATTVDDPQSAPANTGTLKITSTPFGADVYINGAKRPQKTPTELQVPFGETVEVEVRAEGYTPYKKAVTLSQSQDRFVISAQLHEAAAEDVVTVKTTAVRVVSMPPGARLVFDGQPVDGLAPLVIPAVVVGEEHVLILDAEGHESRVYPITLDSDAQLELEIPLRAVEADELGTLVIDSWPRGARVELGQLYAGKTPMPPILLQANTDHPLVITAPNLDPFVDTINLDRGETRSINPRLSAGEEVAAEDQEDAAFLDITSRPDTEVFIDSKSVGKTPLEGVAVIPGTHWIEFRDPARNLRHIEVRAYKANDVEVLDVEIPKGMIAVACEPPALVTVDGELLGQTPQEVRVFVGEHTVKLVAGDLEKTLQVTVQPDKTQSVIETLP